MKCKNEEKNKQINKKNLQCQEEKKRDWKKGEWKVKKAKRQRKTIDNLMEKRYRAK